MRTFGVSVLFLVWCGWARAEPEVRILLQSEQTRVQVTGPVQISADYGPMFDVVSPVILRSGGGLRVDGGPDQARGDRVLVQSADGVRLGKGRYLGRIEVASDGTVVNGLPIETYLLGIVGSEMPASWPLEALKAQAVAARTFAVQRRLSRRARGAPWDLHDSVLSQVYKGADSIHPQVIEAVRQTRGVVLAFRHQPAEALFHSTCGGRTRAAEEAFGNDVEYLRPRPCRWCRDSNRHRWSVSVETEDVRELMQIAGLDVGRVRGVDRSAAEDEVRVRGKRRSRTMSPSAFRRALGYGRLYSSDFTAHTRRGVVQVEGRGFGHQVGMCQWGARGMALEGRDFRAILQHYYPEVPLKRAW